MYCGVLLAVFQRFVFVEGMMMDEFFEEVMRKEQRSKVWIEKSKPKFSDTN